MGDGMSARKAAAACQTKFQVQIGKTTLQNGFEQREGQHPRETRPTNTFARRC
jgi:hypothetical protein